MTQPGHDALYDCPNSRGVVRWKLRRASQTKLGERFCAEIYNSEFDGSRSLSGGHAPTLQRSIAMTTVRETPLEKKP
jgi:hypothetical protein